jgi:hypothetical protein
MTHGQPQVSRFATKIFGDHRGRSMMIMALGALDDCDRHSGTAPPG